MAKNDLDLKQHRQWCKGCGICVEFCPVKILFLDHDGKVTIDDEEKCIGCRQCELRCPDYAIYLEDKEYD